MELSLLWQLFFAFVKGTQTNWFWAFGLLKRQLFFDQVCFFETNDWMTQFTFLQCFSLISCFIFAWHIKKLKIGLIFRFETNLNTADRNTPHRVRKTSFLFDRSWTVYSLSSARFFFEIFCGRFQRRRIVRELEIVSWKIFILAGCSKKTFFFP